MNTTVLIKIKKFVAQILLLLIIIIFAAMKPATFFTLENLLTIIRQVATMGIVALGVSFLMLTGSLDFSVGKSLRICRSGVCTFV